LEYLIFGSGSELRSIPDEAFAYSRLRSMFFTSNVYLRV
jgi:hypothetical protein